MKTAFSHGKPLSQDFCLPARGFSLTAAFPMQRCDLTQRVEHDAIAHQIGLCPESWDAGLRGRRRPPEKLAAGRCSFPKDAATGWNKPAGGEAWLRGAGTPLTCSTPPLQASPRRTTQSTRLDVVAGGNGARSPVEHGAGSRDVSFPADLSPWLLRTGDAGNESHVGCEPGAGAAVWASVGPWAETRRAEHVVSRLHGKRQGAPHKRSATKGEVANAVLKLQKSLRLRPRPKAGQTGQPADGLPELPKAARERRSNARGYSSSSLYLTRSPSWKGTQKSSSPLSCSSSRTAQA